MSFIPPIPVPIGGGGSGGGGSISNDHASVDTGTDESGNGVITFKTNNTQAMHINADQNVLVGTSDTDPNSRMLITDPQGRCLTLYNTLAAIGASFQIDTNGLSVSTTNNIIRFGSSRLYLQSSNLYLSDTQVVATGDQLNYNNVTPGTAAASKTLVLNSSGSITGITGLAATSLTGTLLTGSQPNISSLNAVNITTLSLGGTQVNSSATELNYLYGIVPGTITSGKAFVFDSTKNLIGVGRITATTIAGTLEAGAQPNISAVGTLSHLYTAGAIGINTASPSTDLEIVNTSPGIKLNNGTVASTIALISNNLQLASDNDIVLSGNTRLQNNTLTGITTLTATTINGTLATANQSAITTVGSLTGLTVLGSSTVGELTTSPSTYRLIINAQNGATLLLQRTALLKCTMAVSASGDLIMAPTNTTNIQSSLLISGTLTGITDLTANTLTGTIQTASQPNINSLGTLTSLAVTNGVTAASVSATSLTGTLQTASQPNITSLGTLTSLAVTNGVTAASVSATNLTGTLQTAIQDNITRTGTLTRLLTTAPLGIGVSSPASIIDINTTSIASPLIISMTDGTNSSTITTDQYGVSIDMSGTLLTLGANKSIKLNGGTIIGLTTLTTTSITGTLQTASQPNITSVGTLGSLAVTNGVTAASVSATSLTGTLQTASQPNITTIGTLGSLAVTNGVTAASVSATNLTGTLQTAIQDNITRTGTLSRLLSTAPLGIGVGSPASVIDIDTSSISSPLKISMTDGINSSSITTNSTGIVLDTSGDYISLGSGKSLKINGGDIIGLTSISAASITGTLQTASQPNITSVGTLDYVDTTYIGLGVAHSSSYRINALDSGGLFAYLDTGTETMTLNVIDGTFTLHPSNNNLALYTNTNLVLDGGTIIGLTTLTASSITGTLQTASQPNITTVGTLGSLTVSGSIGSAGLVSTAQISAPSVYINGGPLTVIGAGSISTTLTIGTSIIIGSLTMTEASMTDLIAVAYEPKLQGGPHGVVAADLALIPDASKNLGTFNDLRATNLYGSIKDANQSLITTIGTLGYLNVSGDIGVGTTTPGQKLEVVSITGNCVRLTNSNTSVSTDLVVDDSGNLNISPAGTTKLSTMMVGNAAANQIPMEVGYTAFTMTSPYSYRTNTGATGIVDPVDVPTSYNYSIRALGRILCTGSIDVMSDRRVKTNIQELTDDYCSSFIKYTTPVRYNRINGDPHESFGYIAQELMRSGFPELVNLIPDDDMQEEIDEDGYISPGGMAYNISYQHIIPILAKNQKMLMKENEELKQKIARIMEMLDIEL
jgi:hypothetical protein